MSQFQISTPSTDKEKVDPIDLPKKSHIFSMASSEIPKVWQIKNVNLKNQRHLASPEEPSLIIKSSKDDI